MKRTLAFTMIGLALAAGAASAAPIGVGVGAYGGVSYPIVQDDVSSGSVFGIRVPVKLIPLVTVEPYYLSSALGDGEVTLGGVKYTRAGFDNKGFGLNAMLGQVTGMGFHFYPLVGVGSHKLTRSGTPDIKETAYNFGLGFGIGPAPKISIQVRGELNMVVTGDTSRKFANATAGLTYDLLP
ncbi:MAG TPA: hypothetical protein VF363_06725 [Candidatus Eisenbacteria bacterium]